MKSLEKIVKTKIKQNRI